MENEGEKKVKRWHFLWIQVVYKNILQHSPVVFSHCSKSVIYSLWIENTAHIHLVSFWRGACYASCDSSKYIYNVNHLLITHCTRSMIQSLGCRWDSPGQPAQTKLVCFLAGGLLHTTHLRSSSTYLTRWTLFTKRALVSRDGLPAASFRCWNLVLLGQSCIPSMRHWRRTCLKVCF